MGKHDGERFGRLVVLETWRGKSGYRCRCKCDCGNVVDVSVSNIVMGITRSCGCLRREIVSATKSTHGESQSRLYRIWKSMRRRCYNPSDRHYAIYGGLGITVCNEWENYQNFANWAKYNGYTDVLTIDRINPYGNYEPSNCRWATQKEQGRNKRDTIFITIGSETKSLAEWCEEKGVVYGTALHRFRKQHLTGNSLFERQKLGPHPRNNQSFS